MKTLLYLIFISAFLGSLGRIFGDGDGISITIFQVLLVLALGVWMLKIYKEGKFELKVTGLETLMLLFFGVISFSLIISSNQVVGLFNFARFVILTMMILMIVNSFLATNEVRNALVLIAIIGVALGGYSAINYLLNPDLAAFNYLMQATTTLGRGSIGDDDPNFFAAMLFLSGTTLATIVHSQKMTLNVRVISLIGFGIVSAGIISTFSRSAWVSFFIALMVIIWLTKNYRYITAAVVVAPVLLLFVSSDITVLLENVMDRFSSIFEGSNDASSNMRIILGIAGLEMFFDSYGLGVGFGGFPEVFKRANEVYGMTGVNQPHNITYQVLAEMGIAGILVFGVIILKLLSIGYNNVKLSKAFAEWDKVIAIALFSAFIGYLVFHQFIPRFFTNTTLMVTIGLMLTHHQILLTKEKPAE